MARTNRAKPTEDPNTDPELQAPSALLMMLEGLSLIHI